LKRPQWNLAAQVLAKLISYLKREFGTHVTAPNKTAIVSKETLQQMFNEGRYWERAVAGEFRTKIRGPGTNPAPPEMNQPPGTVTQTVGYYDRHGKKIAVVHQYLLPDGVSLGGSGRPDPKALVVGDTLYHL